MRIQAKIPIFLWIYVFIVARPAGALDATFKESLEDFSYNMYRELLTSNDNKNIIYSPFSTQSGLAMVRMGADGETATEMDRVLGFTAQSAESIADNYYSLLAHYENSEHVHVANKVYVMEGHELQNDYSEDLSKHFFSLPDSIDFAQNEMAAHTMNGWVEAKTNNRIKNLVQPDDLDEDTRLVLINALHFQGEWKRQFEIQFTKQADFYINELSSVKVPMMITYSTFDYGKFPELHASAIRLPYKDCDLSMLIVLPDSRTGLAEMQEKLMQIKLESLATKMSDFIVDLRLPKFEVEYEIEMSQPLKKLGMKHVFKNADLSKMLNSSEPLVLSKVLHKAFIKVTETGTEAAAATQSQAYLRSAHYSFVVDHPFYFAILNRDNVIFFQGNVVEF